MVTKYECGNCGHVDTSETLNPDIKHYWERVDEDGPEPSGECSKCGCLSYEIVDPPPLKRGQSHGD